MDGEIPYRIWDFVTLISLYNSLLNLVIKLRLLRHGINITLVDLTFVFYQTCSEIALDSGRFTLPKEALRISMRVNPV